MKKTNKENTEAMDLSESSREKIWKHPSFVGEIFNGNFNWDFIYPFPKQKESDKKIGDKYLKMVEDCLKKYINPAKVDETKEVPEKGLKELKKIGCFGMKIPQKYGGLGLSITNYNRVMVLVGSYCSSTAVCLSAHQSIGAPEPLKLFGTEEQKKKFLPRLAQGAISAFALTEPEVGSDPARVKTKAKLSEDGKHYILNGTKMWITNGPIAEILVIVAQTEPKIVDGKEKKQLSAFLLETKTKGFSVKHDCEFMGLKGISNGVLQFKDVLIPKENLIGKEGDGLRIGFTTLNTGRLTIPAISTALGKVAMKHTREWILQRKQWGKYIGNHQAVGKMVTNISANTLAMESITWLSSAMAENHNLDIRIEAAMAKYFCSERAWSVVDDAVQIRGGRGYETETSLKNRGEKPYPFERMLRDLRINRIIEGTTQIMELFITREAMDMHYKRLMPLLDSRTNLKEKIITAKNATLFYSTWYPKQLFNINKSLKSKHLNSANKNNLKYVQNTCKKLSRTMFNIMALYKKKLEHEEILLSKFVEIGTSLFAMSSILSYTDYKIGLGKDSESMNELTDYFCKKEVKLIKKDFKEIWKNNSKLLDRVNQNFMDGKYSWMEEDIMK